MGCSFVKRQKEPNSKGRNLTVKMIIKKVHPPLPKHVKEIFTEINLTEGECVIRHLEPVNSNDGMPIILLPGIGGFAETFLYNFSALVEAGFRPMAVDNIGFGKSTFSSSIELTPEIFSIAVAKWLDKLKIQDFFAAGNSFGGGVALGLWPLKKENLKGLILISSAGFGKEVWFLYKLASLPILNHITVRLAINGGIRVNGRSSWKPVVFDISKVPELMVDLNSYYRTRIETRPAYEFILKEMLTVRGQNPKAIEQIMEIAQEIGSKGVPTLVIWGEDDRVIPCSHGRIAAELMRGKLHILSQCGHMPYLEYPEEVSELMVQFLQESTK